jgi:hypothetical protein
MTNVFTSGLLAATYALAWVIFCEYLSGIDESLCWQNWATVLTPRMAITTLGAGFGAFSIPFFLAIMIGEHSTTYTLNAWFFILLWASVSSWLVTGLLLGVEFILHTYVPTKDDMLIASDGDTASLRVTLTALAVKMMRSNDELALTWRKAQAPTTLTESRWAGEVKDLFTGSPEDAARGVNVYMQVGKDFQMPSASGGINQIAREFEEYGTPEDKECLAYVRFERAGTSIKVFPNGQRDCDIDGRVMDSRLTPEGLRRRRAGHPEKDIAQECGMLLEDFINLAQVQTAGLDDPEVRFSKVSTRLFETRHRAGTTFL